MMDQIYKLRTRKDLASALGIPYKKLTYILYKKGTDNCYVSFHVPKRSGGEREICAPDDDLKEIQKKLASFLQDQRSQMQKDRNVPQLLSHGFEPGKNIFTNAKIHRNKRFVLNLDLEDFFGSIHFGRIVGYLEKNKSLTFSHEVAVAIAQLCCYQGKLPQGAPTSPVLANMVSEVLDFRLLKIARKYRLDYTRYADDLSFSTNDSTFLERYESCYHELSGTIKHAGFAVNEKKSRLQYRDSRQTVTGLVVNRKINIDRRYYKETRAMAHQLYKTGEFQINGAKGTLNQLEGRFAFIHQCDLLNSDHLTQKGSDKGFTAREIQYQKFLFYKTFYAHDAPLLVMEGPTDILYLKAALMNMYMDYPNLIQKEHNGTFTFKIRFFQRTPRKKRYTGNYQENNPPKPPRWKYLFAVTEGADSLGNIYDFFAGENNRPNYFDYFSKICKLTQLSPVILILDNELETKNKPIRKFIGRMNIKERVTDDIKRNNYSHVLKDSNLHLVTHQLCEGKKEGEIESLFTKDTLSTELGGKQFNPIEKTFDKSKHYGKDIFSKYILSHYETINFDGFRPMLDRINSIITESEKIPQSTSL